MSGVKPIVRSIFSIDVEDWFHILDVPGTPKLSDWVSLPHRVERNFLHLLDLLDETSSKGTCFFLGWIAQRYPHLVREALGRGHEMASHGFVHQLAYNLGREKFFQDALFSKRLLEDIGGQEVLGYRAAGFSCTEATPWFFEALAKAGYLYDSSIFPAPRGHGGMRTDEVSPYMVRRGTSELWEFPISVVDTFGRKCCFFGGGYLRLFPLFVIRRMVNKVMADGRPVIFYIHPREIDPAHPRLEMSLKRKFKSYVNLRTTEVKIRSLLAEFPATTFQNFIRLNNPDLKLVEGTTHPGPTGDAQARKVLRTGMIRT